MPTPARHRPPGSYTRALLVLLAAAIAGTLRAVPTYAQAQVAQATLSGRVVDLQSRNPIARARVFITGLADTLTADDQGRFTAEKLATGAHVLEVRAVGYRATRWTVELISGPADIAIELQEVLVTLDTLRFAARPPVNDPDDWRSPAAFELRSTSGVGQFITPDLLRRTHARTLGEVMRQVPGVWVACAGHRCDIRLLSSTRPCTPRFFLDGHPANNSTGPDFPLQRILGIEVYRASDAPMQLQVADERCGVVAIWTRMDGATQE